MPDFNVAAAYGRPATSRRRSTSSSERVNAGDRYQTLLGATGTGKTATMAWIIERVQKPTLVIAHNKTLAAQLCNEFREFFPSNAVEYFVSYYDYYQPEAYVPARRPLHREGRLDQRRHRPPAPCCDERAVPAARRRHRRLGVVHLRARLARGVPRADRAPVRRGDGRPRRGAAEARRHPVPAQRLLPRPRPLPRPRRRRRGAAVGARDRVPGLVLRGRGRADLPLRPAVGRGATRDSTTSPCSRPRST